MRREFLSRLQSEHRVERMRAWSELYLESEVSQNVLSGTDRQQLAGVLAAEDDDGVHRLGSDILIGFSCCACGDHDAGAADVISPASRCRSLDDWLWSDFRKPSAIFRASEQGYHRRDADAVESLARRLGIKEFPQVNFQPLPLHKDGWRQLTTERAYKTIGLVGRLGLFGDRAQTDLQWKDARFRFLRQTPPASYEAGEELRQYYCLQEFEGGRVINQYYTEDMDGARTDYGIVQRYPLFLGAHWITVVVCCGSSSLGTLAAAHWAALDLGVAQDPSTEAPISLPKTIGSDSCLEALIRTTGASQTHIWLPSSIELLGLYIDHYRWSPTDLQWHDVQQHLFEIRLRGGEPVALIIDGERAKLNPGSQNFRLAAKVILGVSQSRDRAVDVLQLAHDREIWDGRELPASKVKQRLHNLDRQALKGTLSIDHRVTLDADITVAEE